ncbi:MAG TPA: hypothetical protein VN577_08190 [Terriglobales bacterium]|nr:hypothetical protein [Terriglobales bacterium]
MKTYLKNYWIVPISFGHYFCLDFCCLLLLMLVTLWPASAQQPSTPPYADAVPLSAEQVVHNLVQMNLHRAQALDGFQGTRIYRAEYRGFPGDRSAEMIVNVSYVSPATKEFKIRSATGSKLIIDKVFMKLLEAEKEALDSEMQRRSALTEDNYRFTLIGLEAGLSGSTYMLQVEPLRKDKYLYRGRIWVDAVDFAVVRLEAVPARNPSFWTRRSEIVQLYSKFGDFWLPASNHSISTIRLGGHADLTIGYTDYEITGTTRVSSLPMHRSSSHMGAVRAQE